MRRSFIKACIIFVLTIGVISSACMSPRGSVSPVAEPSKIAPASVSAATQAGWEKEWQQVLAAARKEGKVVYYTSLGGQARLDVQKAFTEKYGIELEVTSANGPVVAEKITAERRAGLFYVDVSTTGSTTTTISMKPKGQLAPIPPALILPEVKDPKAWWRGDLDWGDKEKTILNFSAFPNIPLAINSDIIKREDIKSWRDLLNPRWKGKVSLNDPTVPGSGLKLIGAVGGKIMGMDFVRELAKMEPIVIRNYRLQTEWLAQGKYPITVIPDSPTTIEFKRLGAPIVDFIPVEGTYLSSGYGVVVLLDKAPHPNAAKVFLNWLLGKDGGFVWSKALNTQSGRVDVPTDHLDQNKVRQPGVTYVEAYGEEFILKEPEHMQTAREIFGHLIK